MDGLIKPKAETVTLQTQNNIETKIDVFKTEKDRNALSKKQDTVLEIYQCDDVASLLHM